jgi:hypothetical protein
MRLVSHKDEGYIAFWHGRPVFANPKVGDAALEWKCGWDSGAEEFRTSVGGPPTTSLIAAHRPDHVPCPATHKVKNVATRHGSGRAARRAAIKRGESSPVGSLVRRPPIVWADDLGNW